VPRRRQVRQPTSCGDREIVAEVTEGEITSVRSPKMREWVLERVGPRGQEADVDGEKYSIDKTVRANLLAMETPMRFRPMLPRSSNARTTYGRLRLRSSAALQTSQMKKITESDGRFRICWRLCHRPCVELRRPSSQFHPQVRQRA
jgi:hypothetical protein